MTTETLEPGRIPADPSVCDGKPELEPDAIMERVMAHLYRLKAPPGYRGYTRPFWSIIGDITGNGSGYSSRICVRYGYDPDLKLKAKYRD